MKARNNPFRVERLERLALRSIGWNWEELNSRLRKLHFRGAIVGPHGSGKTTLLKDLGRRLSAAGHSVARFTLRDEVRSIEDSFFQQPLSGRIVLLDGAEQLPPREWRAFLQRTTICRGLVVTSHVAGFLPTLVECRSSERLLEDLFNDLLTPSERASLGDLPIKLWRSSAGNLHDVFRELYHCSAEGQLFCTLSD